MNQKLLIVLFSTILCNGVTYSSSAVEQFSVTKLQEEKSRENSSVTENTEKKVELALVNSTDHSVPVIQNKTSIPQNINNQTAAQHATVISNPIDKNITGNSSAEIVKSGNQDSVFQNISKVVDNKTSSSRAVDNKNATSSDDIPVGKNSFASSSTSTTVNFKNISSVKTTIIPTVSTVAPTPALTTKVLTEQNTPAPAQEKHFDGPSFIGGIVLTIGLTAIGFIAFKYYKSGKIDMNYRTL